MIERNKLVLHQITEEEYVRLKEKAREDGRYYKKPNPRPEEGFALIEKPLVFRSYEELLWNFKYTRFARHVSVRIKQRDWYKVGRWKLNGSKTKELSDIARNVGFVYLSFKSKIHEGYIDNEIGFEMFGEEVVSSSLSVPGEERDEYQWIGEDKHFIHIRGIYVPEHAARKS